MEEYRGKAPLRTDEPSVPGYRARGRQSATLRRVRPADHEKHRVPPPGRISGQKWPTSPFPTSGVVNGSGVPPPALPRCQSPELGSFVPKMILSSTPQLAPSRFVVSWYVADGRRGPSSHGDTLEHRPGTCFGQQNPTDSVVRREERVELVPRPATRLSALPRRPRNARGAASRQSLCTPGEEGQLARRRAKSSMSGVV